MREQVKACLCECACVCFDILTISKAAHKHQQEHSTLERHDWKKGKIRIQKHKISFSKLALKSQELRNYGRRFKGRGDKAKEKEAIRSKGFS